MQHMQHMQHLICLFGSRNAGREYPLLACWVFKRVAPPLLALSLRSRASSGGAFQRTDRHETRGEARARTLEPLEAT